MNQPIQVIKQGMGRPHLQLGGPRPFNPLLFYGGTTNYLAISGVSNPLRGGITPQYVHAPNTVGKYVAVAKTIDPPDLPTSSIMFREKVGALPKHALFVGCEMNVYLPHGSCNDLSDFDRGWTDYIEIFARGLITTRDGGDRFTFNSDDPLETTVGVTWGDIYPVGSLGFSALSTSGPATRPIVAVCYANKELCGECGPANDGTNWVYAVRAGDGSNKPDVLWSNNGGRTFTAISLTTAVNSEVPSAISVMGSYVVVLSPTAVSSTQGGIYYAVLNPLTGVPGSFTKISTGFTNNRKPSDFVVLGPREAYISAQAGEVLKMEDPTVGAVSIGQFGSADFNRIDAFGDVIVCTGVGGVVSKSTNRGRSFAATTASPSATAGSAIAVLSPSRYLAGTDDGSGGGGLYYTVDAGETWTEIIIPGISVQAIKDITVASDEVIHVAYLDGSTPGIATTVNGGVSWVTSATVTPRMNSVPLSGITEVRRIAVPEVLDKGIASNVVFAVGLGATTTGFMSQGVANVF